MLELHKNPLRTERSATMKDMKFTVDLSGRDDDGNTEIVRFGGLFFSAEDALVHGQNALTGRLVFTPKTIWVRDQAGEVVSKTEL